jgi:hypothetical protein
VGLPRILNLLLSLYLWIVWTQNAHSSFPPVLSLHAQRDFWKINPAHCEIQESETQHAKSQERNLATSEIQESKTQRTQTFRGVKLSMPRVMKETWRPQRSRWFRKLYVIWPWEKGNSAYSEIQESETLRKWRVRVWTTGQQKVFWRNKNMKFTIKPRSWMAGKIIEMH